jgi:hypothetical protein
MKKNERLNLTKFYRRTAHHHIFFGLAMAAAHWNRPVSEVILIYRERTGDEETTDDALYRMKARMIEEFKTALDEVVTL